MIEPSVTLQFSEELNEFRYLYLKPEPKLSFVTIQDSIGITDAVRFVEETRATFPHPLLYLSVVCQFNAWKLKNKI